MAAWAAFAITAIVLIAWSSWRLSRIEDRALWWPGVGAFVIAALAMIVLAADGGYWTAISMFGGVVLASDVLLLKSVLVTTLCTRPKETPP